MADREDVPLLLQPKNKRSRFKMLIMYPAIREDLCLQTTSSDLLISSVTRALLPPASFLWLWIDETAADVTAVVLGVERVLIFQMFVQRK